jgi:hypothetical protein
MSHIVLMCREETMQANKHNGLYQWEFSGLSLQAAVSFDAILFSSI